VRSANSYHTLEGSDAIRGDNRRAPYVYFMPVLPPHAHIRVVTLTSKRIQAQGMYVKTSREIPKNFRLFPALLTRDTSSRKTLFAIPNFGRKTYVPLYEGDGCS
jgi:hypothetical protein